MLDTFTFFPVELQPIFDQHGNEIDGNKCVMRTDTNEVLGVHGSRYKLVKHEDIIERVYDAVKEANITSDFQIKYNYADNGAKLRGEVNFPDLTIEPKVGDISNFKVTFLNSYDASWSFQMAANALRLLCSNGMVRPEPTAKTRFKHTLNINVQGAADKVRLGVEGFMQEESKWAAWSRIQVDDYMAELFFKHTLAKAPSKQMLKHKQNDRQLEKLLGIWQNEKAALGPNKWALYNAMTYWSTHTNDTKNPLVAQQQREEKVMQAMNDSRFTHLEVAY